jgi:hypothetical protein
MLSTTARLHPGIWSAVEAISIYLNGMATIE